MNIPDYWGVGKGSPFKAIKIQPNKKTKSAITSLDQGHHWNSQFWANGKQFSWTKGGEEFSWTKNKAIPKKDMNYKQANQFFSLTPIGDADRDGVPNWRDCRPYDSSRQGKHFDAFKEKVGGVAGKVKEATGKVKEKFQTSLTDFPDVEKPDVTPAVQPIPPTPKSPPRAKPKKRRSKKTDTSTFETSYTVEGDESGAEPLSPAPDTSKKPDWYMFVKFANRKWEQVAVLPQNQIKGAVEDFKRNFPNVEDIQVSQNLALLGKLNRKLAIQHAKETVSDYAERQQFKKHIKEGLGIKKDTDIQSLRRRMGGLESGMQRPVRMPMMGSAPRIGMGGAPPVGLVMPPSSLRGAVGGGGGGVPQTQTTTASPQQTVKISIPQAFGGPQTVGTPLVQTEPEDVLPESEETELLEEHIPEEHKRKVPPGAQEYAPVTREQSSISRPLLRAPYQDQRPTGMGMGMGGRITEGRMLPPPSGEGSSRPVGMMPIAEFRQAPPIRFMTFGRKVKE